jgi:hypothetical protein
MALIKPRTRGKRLVRHRKGLDYERTRRCTRTRAS